MSDNTRISWTDASWNPIVGCSKIAAGCRNCYAEKMAVRLAAMGQQEYQRVVWWRSHVSGLRYEVREAAGDCTGNWNGRVVLVESALTKPLRWRKPRRIFVNSMSDLFHEAVPFEWVDRILAVVALCPQHQFQCLTKRPERMHEYMKSDVQNRVELACESIRPGGGHPSFGGKYVLPYPLPNLHLGISASTQADLDAGLPHLLNTPAAVRFVSLEPLVEAVTVSPYLRASCSAHPGRNGYECCSGNAPRFAPLHWVIIGGESGHNARPCNVEWIRSIVGQCKDAGVPVFVKQLGADPYEAGVCHVETEPSASGLKIVPRATAFACKVIDGDDRLHLRHRSGADPTEWPEDLRVQQFPEAKC